MIKIIKKQFILSKSTARLTLIALILLSSSASALETPSLSHTKNKLKELDSKINKLKQTLSTAHDKRSILDKELSGTKKQIGEGMQQLQLIQQGLERKKQKIVNLQQQYNDLNKQLLKQQQLLGEHLRIRYKIGEYQPLKWLLNQDDPHAINRLLSFHQYFIQSRQKIIAQIDETKRSLALNQESLKSELHSQLQSQNELNSHQQQLEKNKLYHQTLLHSLINDIQVKQLTLSEFERNKENLSKLLKNLVAQNFIQTRQPFVQMRKKLPKPIQTENLVLQKMNQGMTFFAGEGTAVKAVYPGKVVFSDWLNGYGFLLILDHGQGYMTLYANNKSLTKHKGSTVQQGEQIAAVGHSGGLKQNGLYFEVRYRGKAVSPTDWLS
ncbi:MAG: peptidoglycan DD-metalloendopeptidase family protein [Tatlockia sp.]|nr:peptidoglycan DD-metalloendopeptidase family protein [Tatlockia sp.]